ncbi:MAG TPA: STM3941 family protein [Steroidobacteraceae bacterium]|nr:STM3941 family protein [Steroidobacteraceae bacterium]
MTCYRSLPKLLGLLLLAIVMTAVSAWCATLPQMRAQVFGWLGVAFFGFGLLVIARELFRRGPVVVVDDLSITDHRSGDGPVFWDQIRSVWIGSVRSSKFLCIELKDPDLFASRWSARRRAVAKTNEALGFPPVTIGFAGLSPGLSEVANLIRATQPDKFAESAEHARSTAG